jgi:hypothetical protein
MFQEAADTAASACRLYELVLWIFLILMDEIYEVKLRMIDNHVEGPREEVYDILQGGFKQRRAREWRPRKTSRHG